MLWAGLGRTRDTIESAPYVIATGLLVGMLIAAPMLPATRGQCLDSAKWVPMNMLPDNSISSDVVRTDTLWWSKGNTTQILGFVYTLQRGDSWFGARKATNLAQDGAAKLRGWLRVAAEPKGLADEPFDENDNGAVSYPLKPDWRGTLKSRQLSTITCVLWPKNKPLPR